MDGRGRYEDNIFVERLWRTVKYEEVYLKAYANGLEAHRGLREYLRFYNERRPHQGPWATGRRRRSSTASLWKRIRREGGTRTNRSWYHTEHCRSPI